jgi:hypothetical protein
MSRPVISFINRNNSRCTGPVTIDSSDVARIRVKTNYLEQHISIFGALNSSDMKLNFMFVTCVWVQNVITDHAYSNSGESSIKVVVIIVRCTLRFQWLDRLYRKKFQCEMQAISFRRVWSCLCTGGRSGVLLGAPQGCDST